MKSYSAASWNEAVVLSGETFTGEAAQPRTMCGLDIIQQAVCTSNLCTPSMAVLFVRRIR